MPDLFLRKGDRLSRSSSVTLSIAKGLPAQNRDPYRMTILHGKRKRRNVPHFSFFIFHF